jgi:peptidoglycan lytic transglycosylase
VAIGAVAVRTAAGNRRNAENGERFRKASSRILLGCWLTVILSAGFVGGNVELTRASPLQLASSSVPADHVVVRLRNPWTTPGHFWLRGVDAIENASGGIVRVSTSGDVVRADEPSRQVGDVIIGAASMYNPYDEDDNDAGGVETASGELYDPIAWTAAIQSDLRGAFAGVRYGRLYRPSFALVEVDGRRAIVKINDIGPLRPGRVIDFSKQTMHYFDPSLKRGVLDGVLVTPLIGSGWTPGPLGPAPAVTVATAGGPF